MKATIPIFPGLKTIDTSKMTVVDLGPMPPRPKATINAEYNIDGDLVDPNLPESPISPGNTLPEMTVLHIYRRDYFDTAGELALFAFYCHPNPAAVDAKQRELADNPSNWHVDRVRYVRSDLVVKGGSR